MEPRAGQVWKFVDSVLRTEEYIFITNIDINKTQQVCFYFIANSAKDGWDYMETFNQGVHYQFVSG